MAISPNGLADQKDCMKRARKISSMRKNDITILHYCKNASLYLNINENNF